MAAYRLCAPLTAKDAAMLRAGDLVLLSGIVYTARDAAHKKLAAMLDAGAAPPFPLCGAVIYYVGPTPAPADRPIGSAGPTSSYRMDSFTPRLHSLGLRASIGKGTRGACVKQALKDHGCVYFGATGGAGALLSMHVCKAEVIAFAELGPEAIRMLSVSDLPLLVINDSVGGDLYVKPNLAAMGLE